MLQQCMIGTDDAGLVGLHWKRTCQQQRYLHDDESGEVTFHGFASMLSSFHFSVADKETLDFREATEPQGPRRPNEVSTWTPVSAITP